MTAPVVEVDRRGLALRVSDLVVRADRVGVSSYPVSHVSWSVARGEAFGLVGESGSGKSLTLRAIAGLLPDGVRRVGGELEIAVDEDPARGYDPAEVRGRGLSMVFQDPMQALNPTMRVGDVVTAGPRAHQGWSRRHARRRAVELLAEVGMPEPARQARMWPHELSGGLRQRVLIAMALATEPRVLLCDEPTTALDAVVQDQILVLLRRIRDDRGLSIVFVTHDLGVIRRLCDRVAVMYAGQIVEVGGVEDVFTNPTHPYTHRLLACTPTLDSPRNRPLAAIPGHQPEPTQREPGCRFAPRCEHTQSRCRATPYRLAPVAGSPSLSACVRADELVGSQP